ncbi:hypothetical protein HF325_004014 [Metschnikowia pulcherrima]|uniref:THIF-type NAD/FAD binding fold domain-containing protein n=1 Tax=Metschnikowia pulcherrima TaxID=27326 RepID=A0A8H7LB56_9ASCO|nr:hypothetical protein HF325_004014 [Metschnikowia pulcherrima]
MSTGGKLAAAVAVTAVVSVAAVEAFHRYIDNKATPKCEKKSDFTAKKPHSEELIREQLARNYAFLSEEGMAAVRGQRIVVIGAGGVGSWVVTMLIRSGVETVRIIDFDQVSLSSLNRHAVANLNDVGTSKVECLRTHLHQIAPWAEIQVRNQLWNVESGEELIFGGDFKPTLVVDCIDNIDTKVDLLAFCHEKKVKVISSGGAACKSDPTRINIADLLKTEEDPLARAVRIRLTKRGIIENIPVVFSAEKPDPRKAKLLPLDQAELEKGDVDQLSALQNFRVRILPVLGTMPGMFGLALATHILTTVAGYPTEYVEGKNRIKVYDGILQSLAGQQSRIGHLDQRTPIALKDVPYIVEEVFRGKSVVSNYSTRLTLSRWDAKQQLGFQNIVVMTKDEQKTHEERVLKGGEDLSAVYNEDVLERVQQRFREEKYYSTFR